MAEKKVTLPIAVGTIDKVTAKINAINKKLDGITKPTRELGKAIKDFGEKSGMGAVVEGFQGVGGAVADLLGKVAMVGGVAAAAVLGLKSLVDEFDDLGDLAERLGVNVDFLAAMRYAAERSGASVEQLDAGMQTFVTNLGKASAGKGALVKFLSAASPVLLAQLKAAKSTEQAFNILADAMSKVESPAKRAALATAALGDAALAPLLARGSRGILELRGAFAGLAGSQEGAAEKAGVVDDSMKDLHAAIQGVKAALVEGLAPAMGEIVEQLKQWFVDHRSDIRQWASDIGKKLPAAVNKIADVVRDAVTTVADIIDKIGGLKVAAVTLAAVIAGPLISSIVSLGIAIAATPVGWILAAIAAIAAAIYIVVTKWNDGSTKWKIIVDAILFFMLPILGLPLIIYRHWGGISAFFVKLWGHVTDAFSAAWDYIKPIVDKVVGAVDAVVGAGQKLFGAFPGLPGQDAAAGPGAGAPRRSIFNPFPDQRPTISSTVLSAAAGLRQQSEVNVKVDFANAPRGLRVSADPQSTASVDLSVGYQMGGA